jgi:hypothetical protein
VGNVLFPVAASDFDTLILIGEVITCLHIFTGELAVSFFILLVCMQYQYFCDMYAGPERDMWAPRVG